MGLNVKDLVEICTQYEVKKANLNINGRDDGKVIYGLCCPESRQILLEPRQDHNEMRDSFIHEALHAHLYITGKGYGMSVKDVEKYVEAETKKMMHEWYGLGGYGCGKGCGCSKKR